MSCVDPRLGRQLAEWSGAGSRLTKIKVGLGDLVAGACGGS